MTVTYEVARKDGQPLLVMSGQKARRVEPDGSGDLGRGSGPRPVFSYTTSDYDEAVRRANEQGAVVYKHTREEISCQ